MIQGSLALALLLAASNRLAVLDVKARLGVSAELAQTLTEALTHEVRRLNPGVDVLGAGEIRSMLEIQRERTKMGCEEDVGCLAEIGGALGAARMVTGSLSKLGTTYLLSVELVDVRQAHVLRDGSETLEGRNDGDLLAAVAKVSEKLFPGPTEAAPASGRPLNRISLIYDPELPISSGPLGLGDIAHAIGLELSTPLGRLLRYHAQLAYVNTSGISGVRLDPLMFGWAIPIWTRGDLRLELEPTLSILDAVLVVGTDAMTLNPNVPFLFLSSGVGAQINVAVGPLYAFVSPVGFEVRYFQWASDTGAVTTGDDLSYRIRVGVGFQL